MKSFPLFRDLSLFVGGMAGVVHETLLTHNERPTLLLLFAAMMGLPAFLRPGEVTTKDSEHKAATKEQDKEKP